MEKIELRELVGGALQEQFAKSFEKVIENLQNPNTPYKVNREINIKLKFAQNEHRDDVKCGILVSEKLAPQSPMETSFAIGTDLRTGKVYAHEYGKQIKGQMSIEDEEHETKVIDGVKVDLVTGEIVEDNLSNDEVIDFRSAK